MYLLEKLIGSAAGQEIPRILWNPKVHYCTHKCPPTVPNKPTPSSPHNPLSLPEDPSVPNTLTAFDLCTHCEGSITAALSILEMSLIQRNIVFLITLLRRVKMLIILPRQCLKILQRATYKENQTSDLLSHG